MKKMFKFYFFCLHSFLFKYSTFDLLILTDRDTRVYTFVLLIRTEKIFIISFFFQYKRIHLTAYFIYKYILCPIMDKIVEQIRLFNLGKATHQREGKTLNSKYAVWRICDTIMHYSSIIRSSKKCGWSYTSFHYYKQITYVLHLLV